MRPVDDPDELAALFGRDRAVHAYGLADLDEPYWSASRWYVDGDAAVGIVGLGAQMTTVYAVSTADSGGSLALVVDLLDRIPAGTMITGPVGLGAVVARHRAIDDLGPHVKYVYAGGGERPDTTRVVALRPADSERLAALHATAPGEAFMLDSMLDDDTFVAVEHPAEPTRLIAAAGTHVISERYRVAAVGGVLVDPGWRGRGLGGVVTAGVLERLVDRVDTIALNVDAANTVARRTYRRLGFRPVLTYEEVVIRS